MSENLTTLQEDTLRLIRGRGVNSPITGREVASAIGLKERKSGKDGADLRSIINALRVKGYPICATGEGYWWPETDVELNGYIESFQGRIDDQQRACDGIKKGFMLVTKTAKELAPGKPIMVRWEDTIYEVSMYDIDDFLLQHPGSVRV